MKDGGEWRVGDRRFWLTMASDVTRDGMGLELVEVGGGEQSRRAALKVFYSDETGEFAFSADQVDDLPLELIDSLRKHAVDSHHHHDPPRSTAGTFRE